jgi:hypothetical protein
MTMTTDDDFPIPDDITAGLRRAAHAVPHADLHPTGPTLRLRARRRRRRTAGAVCAAAAVLAAVVAVKPFDLLGDDNPDVRVGPADGGDPAPETPSDPGDDPAPELPVQDGLPADFELPALLMPDVWSELLPDGTIREIPGRPADIQPDALMADAVRLSDGRTVTLTIRPPEGVSDEEYSEGEGVYVLSVFDPEGALVDEQEVSEPGEAVALGGEHDDSVVLLRGTAAGRMDVVSVDPATFAETPLTTVDTWPGYADVRAGVLAMVHTAEPAGEVTGGCWLDAIELTEGAIHQIDLGDACVDTVYDVSVSPDGGRATVIYEGNTDGTLTLQVAVVDLWSSGSVVGTASLDGGNHCPDIMTDEDVAGGCMLSRAIGLGWKDDQTWFVIVQDYDAADDDWAGPWGPELDPEQLRAVVA